MSDKRMMQTVRLHLRDGRVLKYTGPVQARDEELNAIVAADYCNEPLPDDVHWEEVIAELENERTPQQTLRIVREF
jgi:hypothetical protein